MYKFKSCIKKLLIVALTLLTLISSQFSVDGNLFSFPPVQPSGKDATPNVFQYPNEIFPVAYGDFNGDKLADIITVSSNRSSIVIYLANKKPPFMRSGPSWHFNSLETEGLIESVTPGDFTGDGLMDLMVTFRVNQTFPPPLRLFNMTCCVNDSVDVEICNHTMAPWGQKNNGSIALSVVKVRFCAGNGKDIKCNLSGTQMEELVQDPMAVDLNRDMVLDLVGEIWEMKMIKGRHEINDSCEFTEQPHVTKIRSIWLSSDEGVGKPAAHYSVFQNSLAGFEMTNPSTNAFVDIDGDLVPELVLITKRNDSKQPHHLQREIYTVNFDPEKTKNPVTFQLKSNYSFPANMIPQVIGQPLFLDLERNGKLVHIIPFCRDNDCEKINGDGLLAFYEDNELVHLPIGPLSEGGLIWTLMTPIQRPEQFPFDHIFKEDTIQDFYNSALTFRVGDYNLDGYPDLIGVVQVQLQTKGILTSTEKQFKAVIFENVPCEPTTANPCKFSRTFKPNFNFLDDHENVISASFFDVRENGMTDVILIKEVTNSTNHLDHVSKNKTYEIVVFENSPNFDSYFMKVLVLSGRACPKCFEKDTPYGSLLTGVLMEYRMNDQNGKEQLAVASQMYRSSHMPLDMPYTIFGIGHSPTFVEHLKVTIGYDKSHIYSHDSHKVIPNSQLVIIPGYPLSDRMSWKVKLFLTPSDAVLHTFGVLIGIVLVVGGIVAGLEAKERSQDRKVRMAEAHRFVM